MTEYCDVERVIAEDRRLLIRRGDRFILIDLDQHKLRDTIIGCAVLAAYIAVLGGIVYLAAKGLATL